MKISVSFLTLIITLSILFSSSGGCAKKHQGTDTRQIKEHSEKGFRQLEMEERNK